MKSVFAKSAQFAFLGFALVIAFAGNADAKNCKTGKACGNACIAKTATCAADAATPAAPAKECKTGKACGNACIAKEATCTK